MDFIKEAITQNEHWQTGKVVIRRAENPLIEREVFPVFKKATKDKFIVILRGLRRVGKSVMAKQLMQSLIADGIDAKKICWFEFDRAMGAGSDELDSLLRFFQNNGGEIIILDEVTFVRGWQDILKRYYDRTDIRFVVTGSSALELDKRSSESMAGRYKVIKTKPFSFVEYLRLKGQGIPGTELERIRKNEKMVQECAEFLRSGGLPEAILLDKEERAGYVKGSFLDPVFFKDIPAVFPSAKPDLLLKILELLSASAGAPFQLQSIANIVGYSHPTIALQIDILERALLIRQVFNYTGSLIKQRRTTKKAVFGDNAILLALNETTTGALAENMVAQSIDAKYFWRDMKGREIDFLIPKKKLAIEVKYQEHITAEDEKNLRYFLERRKGWKGIIITKKETKDSEIKRIALWEWLLGVQQP